MPDTQESSIRTDLNLVRLLFPQIFPEGKKFYTSEVAKPSSAIKKAVITAVVHEGVVKECFKF